MTNPRQSKKNKPTRKDALIGALSKRKAPTIAALAETLGIQPHSVRAAISGLRQAGHDVETVRSPAGGAATYRIAPPPDAPLSAKGQL